MIRASMETPQISSRADSDTATQTKQRQSIHQADSVSAGDLSTAGNVSRFDRWLVRKVLQLAENPPIAIVLWDGEAVTTSNVPPVARIFIQDRRTLVKLLINFSLGFGEAYSTGEIEVEGSLTAFCELMEHAIPTAAADSSMLHKLWQWLHRPRRNTLAGSRDNIHNHYDLGNDFYKLWLDDQMLYTCGYFAEPDMSLEQAQLAKMDHVCRKVQLKPGQEVVEAGCGWGGLARHMARNFGVQVKAFNISHEQIVYARERAQAEGLSDRIQFIEDDWRSISGQYDAFVSVGMLEHVGLENYRKLGSVINGCLRKEGYGLIHTIGRNAPAPLDAWTEKWIFPGAYPPSLREALLICEQENFSVLDVENLRLHYAKTLEHWLERYEEHVDFVLDMFDRRFVRTWWLYLSASAATFWAGGLHLFQIVFTHAQNNSIPWTRTHLYRDLSGAKQSPEPGLFTEELTAETQRTLR